MSKKNPEYDFKWCPGCGDFGVRRAIEFAMIGRLEETGQPMANNVVVAGIGCSGNLVHLLEGEQPYGIHGIHGRSLPIALGVKMAKPTLNVVVVAGDGDFLSIGGEHIGPQAARNLNICAVIMDNGVYGLTKGQYSPTSRAGTRSPSSPTGSLDSPFIPCSLALGAGAKFVARGVDTAIKDLITTFKRARSFPGTSFVEIFQNCIVYNDKVFSSFTEREVARDFQVMAIHGEPLLFGSEKNKGLRFDAKSVRIEVVELGENGITEKDVLKHDEHNPTLASLLAAMQPPEFPMAVGVLYCAPGETYETKVYNQLAGAKNGGANLDDVIRRGHTWHVKK